MFWYSPFKFLSVSTLKGKEQKHLYQSLYQVQVFVAAKVAGSDGKNNNSFNQTSLYHDERDHMMAKWPHLNSPKIGAKINALRSVSHSRIVLKLIIYWSTSTHRASVSLRQMLFVESRHCPVPFWVLTRWWTVRMLVWHRLSRSSLGYADRSTRWQVSNILALSLQHSPGDTLIALWHRSGSAIGFDIYTVL